MERKKIKAYLIVLLVSLLPSLPVSSGTASAEKQLISMELRDVDLKDVLQIFSKQSGMNLIAAEEVRGKKLTIYIDKVPIEDALRAIIEGNNLTYEQVKGSNIYLVKSLAKPKVETITRVYALNYIQLAQLPATGAAAQSTSSTAASAAGFIDAIKGLLTEYGTIAQDARSNSIIITDIAENFDKIEEAIDQLDTPSPQVMIEVEMLETAAGLSKKIGLEYGENFASFVGPTTFTTFPLDAANSKIDRAQDSAVTQDVTGSTTAQTQLSFGTLSFKQFNVLLKLLQNDSTTKFLARPRILTINNQTAEIKIAASSAIGTTTTTATTGAVGTVTQQAERQETGIILRVTPQINREGLVTMLLEPEVSRVQASNVAGFFDPLKRSAKTTVTVKDGDTITIGGLLQTDDIRSVKKIPLLGDIPVLGLLFRRSQVDKTDTELMIFITPHVVKERLAKAERRTYKDKGTFTREQEGFGE